MDRTKRRPPRMKKGKKKLEIDKYMDKFDTKVLDTVKEFLEVTAMHDLNVYEIFDVIANESLRRYRVGHPLNAPIPKMKRKDREYRRSAVKSRHNVGSMVNSVKTRREKRRKEAHIQEIEVPLQPIMSHDCGGILRGHPIAACERKKSGRTFYIECDKCDFCSELWAKDGKFVQETFKE